MNKILLTDADGVLLNFNAAFDSHMVSLGHDLYDGYEVNYNLARRYNCSNSYVTKIVTQFNMSDSISRLTPYKDAVEYIQKLKNDGFEIIVITALGDSAQSYNHRLANLNNLFGQGTISSLICAPIGGCKSAYLEPYRDSNFVWVEDSLNHAEVGHRMGLRSIMIDHPYNRDKHEHIQRVSNETPWEELYQIVTDHYSSPYYSCYF